MFLIPKGFSLGRFSCFCAIVSNKRITTLRGSSKLLFLIKDQIISAKKEKASKKVLVEKRKTSFHSSSVLNPSNSLSNSFYSILKPDGIRISKTDQYMKDLKDFAHCNKYLIYTKWRISGVGQNSWWLVRTERKVEYRHIFSVFRQVQIMTDYVTNFTSVTENCITHSLWMKWNVRDRFFFLYLFVYC